MGDVICCSHETGAASLRPLGEIMFTCWLPQSIVAPLVSTRLALKDGAEKEGDGCEATRGEYVTIIAKSKAPGAWGAMVLGGTAEGHSLQCVPTDTVASPGISREKVCFEYSQLYVAFIDKSEQNPDRTSPRRKPSAASDSVTASFQLDRLL